MRIVVDKEICKCRLNVRLPSPAGRSPSDDLRPLLQINVCVILKSWYAYT